MAIYIHNLPDWPRFTWNQEKIGLLLTDVRHRQGRLLGKMESLGFNLQAEANLHTLTADIIKSSEIEGEILNPDQVRSSIARRLGIDAGGILIPSDHDVEGVVEMMLDATQQYHDPLTQERLYNWHAAMFPTGRSGMAKIVTGNYRDNKKEDPMQVVSGAMGREKIHFQAPDSGILQKEMTALLYWFNNETQTDAVLKAAIAHVWFVTIHPFDDGNGRIARAITDMQLSRADQNSRRFYSMSSQIRTERNAYYDVLEETQKSSLDITLWLQWFLHCLDAAIDNSSETLALVFKKASFWHKHAATQLNQRQTTMLNKILDGFDGKLTTTKWAKITKSSQDTAGRDIQDLITKGVLEKETGGGRSTSYVLLEISEGT
jgi:Fic family protein